MNDLPFGFSSGDDRDRRDDGRGGSGPGPEDFAAMLQQFGQMISGLGSSLAGGDVGKPVDYDLALRVATSRLGADPRIREGERTAAGEAVRLADLWIDGSTILPSAVTRTECTTPRAWLTDAMPTFRRACDPVAEKMHGAMVDGMPAEAREMMGPLLGIITQLGAAGFGTQLGNALADLASGVLSGSEVALPLGEAGVATLLPTAITTFAESLELPVQQVMVFIAAREAAHQRLFAHVPWLSERVLASIAEHASGIRVDFSDIEDKARGFDPSMLSDPTRMQEAFGVGLEPTITNDNPQALARLEALLALIEGWVDVVVTDALGERLPGAGVLGEAWRRRRAAGSPAEQAFAATVGIELRPRRVRDAIRLWEKLGSAVGTDARDRTWDHPDLLPDASDLDDPLAFVDRALDVGSDLDDPIAAIERHLAEHGEQRDAESGQDDVKGGNGDDPGGETPGGVSR